MKFKLLPVLLAIITAAAMLSACGSSGESKATVDEAVNRVYPDGEGKLYSGTQATTAAAATTATQKTTAATRPAATKPESPRKKAKNRQGSQSDTQPTTITANVPKDNITGANINPNLGNIQAQMANQIRALAVKSISLSETAVTLEAGASKELTLSFNPSNAAIKTCTLSMSNGNASASISGATVKIIGKSAGTARLTVTAHTGAKATCDITVKRAGQTITDDTVLSHSDLCTQSNANRWNAAVAKKLQSLGIRQNTSLHGESLKISTKDYPGNMSYRQMETALTAASESSAKSLMEGDPGTYEFNCSVSPNNKEYVIAVVIRPIENN